MKKLLSNYSFSIGLMVLTFALSLLVGCASSSTASEDKTTERFVKEQFKIYEVSPDGEEIRGELIEGYVQEEGERGTGNGTAEGIYLDKTYYEKFGEETLNVGDEIEVTYNKDDYENEVWDNIVNVEKIH